MVFSSYDINFSYKCAGLLVDMLPFFAWCDLFIHSPESNYIFAII